MSFYTRGEGTFKKTVRLLLLRPMVIVVVFFSFDCSAKNTPNDVSLGVFLLPSYGIVQQVKNQSYALKKLGGKPLYQQRFVPPITIFPINAPLGTIPEIKRIIKKIAQHQYLFRLDVSAISFTQGNMAVMTFKDSDNLQALKRKIISHLFPSHVNNAQDPDGLKLYSERKVLINKYKNPDMLSQPCFPCITLLTETTNAVRKEYIKSYLKQKSKIDKTYGHAMSLGIGYINENGQITKTIAVYPLLSKTTLKRKISALHQHKD